jgi:putative flavoprotein involved in K+ transport
MTVEISPDPTDPPTPLDVLVVGAGQAGLAVGYHLQRSGLRFQVVDAAPRIGESWRTRWDSLRLFTPAEYCSLPGMPFPAPAGTYAGKDDVASYLQQYARDFALPVLLDTPVRHLTRAPDRLFVAITDQGVIRARQVIVATGPFQTPAVPAAAEQLAPSVTQLHSAAYRRPGDLPPGRVVVVGAGNSGLQIADELAAAGRTVTLAIGSRPRTVRQRPFGKDLFWWLTKTRLIERPADSRLARRLQARELVVGTTWRGLRRRGVDLRPRLVSAIGRQVRFADGTQQDVDVIVWATGFRSHYDWLAVPGAVVDGRPEHSRGTSPVDGLHFLGLPWQHTRGSALLGFVQHDAAYLAEQLIARSRSTALQHTPA